MEPTIRPTAKIAVVVIAVLLVAGATELFCRHLTAQRLGDWVLRIADDAPNIYDPLLGWRALKGHVSKDHFGPGRDLSFDVHRFRVTETITSSVPDGRYRVFCTGDSFTFGAGVGDHQAFPALLSKYDPRLQGVNIGLGGYGVDQSVLRYRRDSQGFDHQMVVLAFIGDDFVRMRRRAFQIRSPKPRFMLQDDGTLVLENVPVPTWGRPSLGGDLTSFPFTTLTYQFVADALDRKFVQPHYDEVKTALALFDEVRAETTAADRRMMVVFLPSSSDLEKPCTPDVFGPPFCPTTSRPALAVSLETWANDHGALFVDLTPRFRVWQREGPIAPYFLADGHYSARGLEGVAEVIATNIRRQVFADL